MIFCWTSSVADIRSSLSFSMLLSLRRGRSRIVSGTSTSASPINSSYLPTWVFRRLGNISPVITLSYWVALYCETGALASVLSFQSACLASRPRRPPSLSWLPPANQNINEFRTSRGCIWQNDWLVTYMRGLNYYYVDRYPYLTDLTFLK